MNDVLRVKCRADRQNRLEERLCPPRIGTTATGTANAPKKPLLVLDLNGVLCDRGTYATRDAKQKKSINRPHAAQFVRWCYERFEIGVWSCAKRITWTYHCLKVGIWCCAGTSASRRRCGRGRRR